jgi:hypothetical protein
MSRHPLILSVTRVDHRQNLLDYTRVKMFKLYAISVVLRNSFNTLNLNLFKVNIL